MKITVETLTLRGSNPEQLAHCLLAMPLRQRLSFIATGKKLLEGGGAVGEQRERVEWKLAVLEASL